MDKVYETVLVIKPTIEEDQLGKVVDAVKGLLKKNKAKFLYEESWGKKKLAYEIRKYKRAYYHLIHFEAGPEVIAKLERYYRLSEDIIRSMTMIPEPKAQKALEQKWMKKELLKKESADGKSE